MNERINNLADQCYEDILGVKVFDQEKFAKLIIRECAEVANKHMTECEDINYGVGNIIRRTFGVE